MSKEKEHASVGMNFLSRAQKTGIAAKHCVKVNCISLAASVPVWILAFKAASWNGEERNWDSFRTSFFGVGTLFGQLVVAVIMLGVFIVMYKRWSRFQIASCALLLPLPLCSTLLAMAYGSRFG